VDEQFFNKLSELRTNGHPFVLATVVSCENPTSAKPGAKAVVTADGALTGWIGGSCAQPIVIKEAKKALKDGLPRLLKIGNKEAAAFFGQNKGVYNFEMTCYSGGTMEIFIEPVLPKPHLVLIGNSPDLQALAQLGQVMNFQITVIDPEVEPGAFPNMARVISELDFSQLNQLAQAFMIVATHGRYDEEALEKALATQTMYIGLISSKKRAAAIFDYLRTKGISKNELARINSPAGLDIGAITPDEIALSILAQIIEFRRRKQPLEVVQTEAEVKETAEESIDPICAMTVNVNTAHYKTEYQGTYYYFCCAGCQQKFEQEPEKYIKQSVAERPK